MEVVNVGKGWTAQRRVKCSTRRKAEVAAGINIPPSGNAGNRQFRHSEATKQLMKQRVAEARERIKQERGSYHTPAGLVARKAKMALWLTDERRREFTEATKPARNRAHQVWRDMADEFARIYLPIIDGMQAQGLTMAAIAGKLNEAGYTTRRGNRWTDQTVGNILRRCARKPMLSRGVQAEKARKKNADRFAEQHALLIHDMLRNGLHLSQIADKLNEAGYTSRRHVQWTYQSVGRVIKRLLQRAEKSRIRGRDLSSELYAEPPVKRLIGWDRGAGGGNAWPSSGGYWS